MVYLIVGRPGSGRKTLSGILAEGKLRVADDINARVSDVDLYIAEPEEVDELALRYPDVSFVVVYLSADEDIRRKRLVRDNICTKAEFDSIERGIAGNYDSFEDRLNKNKLYTGVFPDNVVGSYFCSNSENKEALYEAAYTLLASFSSHKNMVSILSRMQAIPQDRNPLEWKDDKIVVWQENEKGEPQKSLASIDMFSDMLLGDKEGFYRVFTSLLETGFIS